MTTNAYPETNVQVIEKALYCLKHGETESVENWLDLLRERLTENSRADALTDLQIGTITDKWAARWSATGAWNTRRCIDNALRELRALLQGTNHAE